MPMTVLQLTESTLLRTRFLAGSSGGSRKVSWAHTCELPQPWDWLGEGELLMCDGYNFPADPEQQETFIEQLASARLAGLVLAEGMHAPPLTDTARRRADSLSFPVLETEFSVPFVAISRTVAEHNSKAAVASLSRILRVYDRLHEAERRAESRTKLLEEFELEAGARLHVIDSSTGFPVLHASTELSGALSAQLIASLGPGLHPLPAFTRLQAEGRRFLALPVGRSTAILIAELLPSSEPTELVLLQHIAAIADLEIARESRDAEAASFRSSKLFARILDGSLSNDGVDARLEAFGFQSTKRWIVAVAPLGPAATDGLQKQLSRAGIAYLLLAELEVTLILTEAPTRVVEQVQSSKQTAAVGVSLPAATADRLPDAVREAKWAREAASTSGTASVVYGDLTSPFLPRTLEEARTIVARVLGPIIQHDSTEGSELLNTLEAYFVARRSWQAASIALGVHKQTVIYRIKKVEALTGRSLGSVADQSELYLALRARQLLAVPAL